MFVFQTLRKWVRNHTGIVLGEEMGQKSYREIAFGDSQLTEDQEASPSCSCSHAAVPRTKNRRGRNKFKKIFTKKNPTNRTFSDSRNTSSNTWFCIRREQSLDGRAAPAAAPQAGLAGKDWGLR